MTTNQTLKVRSEKELKENYFYILRRTIFYMDHRPREIDDFAFRNRDKISDRLLNNKTKFAGKYIRYKYLGLHKFYIGITKIIN